VDWICGCHVMLVNTFVDLLQSYHAIHNIALYFILIFLWPDIAEKLLIRYSVHNIAIISFCLKVSNGSGTKDE
jgi:hypothetical protein